MRENGVESGSEAESVIKWVPEIRDGSKLDGSDLEIDSSGWRMSQWIGIDVVQLWQTCDA